MGLLIATVTRETRNLLAKRSIRILFGLSVLLSVGAAYLLVRMQDMIGMGDVSGMAFPLLTLGVLTTVFLPLLLVASVSDSFAMQTGSANPKSTALARFKRFASRLLAVACLIVLQLALVWASSSVVGLLFMSDLPPEGLASGLVAYGAAFFPLLALGFASALIARQFRSRAAAAIVSASVYVVAKTVTVAFPHSASFTVFAYEDWHVLWMGSSVSFNQMTNVFMFILLCSIVAYTAGLYSFEKREV
ncbi:hypothetical protein [Paenibacillus sp. MBLB4367]|uniref:hypothetical protein n=1 Tax=Paenibacillus sp. MBLB4367 TaxID=3384767 RepID=UPI003907F974